jgi:glycosyltransferase involved in cell wall biosynthesis
MKILLGMPSTGKIPSRTVISLLQTVERGKVDPMIVTGSLVYDARETIIRHAVEKDYDYILFADSDMVFNAEDLKRLLAHNVGICSGLYVTRDGLNNNVAYSKIITRRRFPFRSPQLIVDDTPSGFGRVAACGFGFCLIKTSVIKCMLKYYKALFEPYKGLGEDAAFCYRARRCGFYTFIDRDVKLGHIGETVYGNGD